MNEISLVFYGELYEIDSQLLQKLRIIDLRPRTSELQGYYVIEKKYGKEILRKVSLNFSDAPQTDWIIFKYLSAREKEKLKLNREHRRIYILCHNYISFDYILEHVVANVSDDSTLQFVVDTNNDEFKNANFVTKSVKSKSIHNIIKPRQVVETATEETKGMRLPFVFVFIFKLLLNPLNELTRYSILLKYSNLRILKRAIELSLFIIFLFTMLGKTIYWNFRFFAGVLKVIGIKLGFVIRHLLLMLGFKSFGFFVDSYQAARRLLSAFLDLFYYKTLHKLYFKLIHGFYYKVIFRLYHDFFKKIFHYIWLNFISVIIFDYILQFYHKVIKKIAAKIWVNFLSIIIFDYILQFYHKVIRKLFHYVWVNFLSIVIFKVILQFYHKILKKIFDFLWVRIISPIIFDVILQFYYKVILGFFWFGLIVPFYYKGIVRLYSLIRYNVWLFIRYDVWSWVKLNIFIRLYNFVFFDIRHFFLMVYYKAYGLLVDLSLLLYRVTKLYILFPIRKVYWFMSFQYRKRIKKQVQ